MSGYSSPSKRAGYQGSQPASPSQSSASVKSASVKNSPALAAEYRHEYHHDEDSETYTGHQPHLKAPPSTRRSHNGIKVGDRVLVHEKNAGRVRYIGHMHGYKGIWFGVDLDYPRGRNDGSDHAVIYFQCKPEHGIFSKPEAVRPYDGEVAAAVRIQSMIRRYHAGRRARHRKVFKNWNKLESATESAHFAAASNHNLIVPMLDNLKSTRQDAIKKEKKRHGEKLDKNSVVEPKRKRPALCGLDWGEIEAIEVESDYKGPHLEFPMTNECACTLAQCFLDDINTVVHWKYMVLLLLHVHEQLDKLANPVLEVNIKPGQTLNIIGDTHGQLVDVLWIFNLVGYPTEDRHFFFNGDVADRGDRAVEIFSIIFSFKLLGWLNMTRGNHEAHMLNSLPAENGGGFQREILTKYPGNKGHTLYKVFQEVFNTLPLVGIINEQLCVIHGGLPRRSGIRIEHIKQCDHKREVPCPAPGSSYQDQVFFDMLWSDPCDKKGVRASDRGGDVVMFGPDITADFLQNNDLTMLVRSHQCPESLRGYEDAHDGNVVTVFSASNYGDCGNYGGLLQCKCVGKDEPLDITGHEFMAPDEDNIAMECVKAEMEGETKQRSDRAYQTMTAAEAKLQKDMLKRVKGLVVTKKTELEWYWSEVDKGNTGMIRSQDWVAGMKAITELELDWEALLPYLAPPNKSGCVDYQKFCKRFKVVFKSKEGETGTPKWEEQMLSMLYESVMRADLSLPKVLEAFGGNAASLSDTEIARRMLSAMDLGLSLPQLEQVVKSVRSSVIRKSSNSVTGASFAELFVQTFMQSCQDAKGYGLCTEDVELLKRFGTLIQSYNGSCASIFQQFDVDDDGFVDHEEFVSAMGKIQKETSSLGLPALSAQEITRAGKLIDANGDGHINFIEFCQAFHSEGHRGTVEDLMQQLHTTLFENSVTLASMFQHLDENGDGSVSTSELKLGLSTLNTLLSRTKRAPLSDVQINGIATCIDRNGDGQVEWEEFLDAFTIVDSEAL